MNAPLKYLLLLAVLALPRLGEAQVCDVSMSFNQCSQALNDALDSGPKDSVKAESVQALKTANTGSQAGSDTALQDFNPLLQASIDASGLSSDDNGGLTFSWNDFAARMLKSISGYDGSAEYSGIHHKLTFKMEAPEVYEPLQNAVMDADTLGDLDNSLSDFDDISIDLRFSLNSERYGRNINNHTVYLTAIQQLSIDQTQPQRNQMLSQLDLRNQAIQLLNTAFDMDAPFSSLGDEQTATNLVRLMESSRGASVSYLEAYNIIARQNGLFDLVNMVNNQPQLIFSANARIRDDVAGPDEYSAKLTYEFGGANVNTYRRYRNNACSANNGALAHADEVACLGKFVDVNESAIAAGNRFAFSAEYVRRDSYLFQDHGVMLNEDDQSSFISKLTYGRYLDLGSSPYMAGSKTRFDLSAGYEDVSSDPMRNDRAMAVATLAQEIGNGLFLTVGVEWNNKPEFVMGVDDETTVRAGISYKLPGAD